MEGRGNKKRTTQGRFRGGSALLAGLLILAPFRAHGDDGGGLPYGLNLNASVGYAIPTTDEYSNAFAYRLGVGYSLTSTIEIGFSLGHFLTDIDHDMELPPGNTIADGELDVFSAALALQLRYPVPQLFSTLYAGAGAGYYFIDYSWNDASRQYFRQVGDLYPGPVQKVSDSLGFNFGAGLEYPLSAHFALNLEGQYIYLKPDAEGNWRDLVTGEEHRFSDDLDLDTWIFTVGIRYFF